LIRGDCQGLAWRPVDRVYVRTLKSGRITRVEAKINRPRSAALISMSPDGRFAVVKSEVFEAPAHWRDYRDRDVLEAIKQDAGLRGSKGPIAELMLLDLAKRTQVPLLDAPVSWSRQPSLTWSSDSGGLVIANSWLPLDIADAAEREQRQSMPGV